MPPGTCNEHESSSSRAVNGKFTFISFGLASIAKRVALHWRRKSLWIYFDSGPGAQTTQLGCQSALTCAGPTGAAPRSGRITWIGWQVNDCILSLSSSRMLTSWISSGSGAHPQMTIVADRPGAQAPQPYASFDQGLSNVAPKSVRHSRLKRFARRIFSEGGLVAVLFFALYLAVAILLDFKYLAFNGDAVSRMANGFYVLYSRDPHLAAIGFVWNPGTSIADIAPLLFYHLWTPLASHMFAASLVSASCMAGVVYQVRCAVFEWGVKRAPRLVLVAILGLNGMIVYYGGNGMSEGLYLFTLVASCRYLLRWLRDDDLASLVYSATALGVCYLARNEAVGAAMLAGVVVAGVGYARRTSSRSARIWGGLTDLTIFEFPFVTAFLGWAVVSYVITGQPFEQFTSIYGNSSQEKLSGHRDLHARILTDVHAVYYLAPTLPLVLVVAVYLAMRRRDLGLLAPVTVVGGGLAFDLLGYLANSIQPYFRYFITAVPLEVLVVGSLFATAPALVGSLRPHLPSRGTAGRRVMGAVAVLVALVLLIPASVSTVAGMFNPNVGIEETEFLGFIFHRHLTAEDESAKHSYTAVQSITDYLDNMHLADGQVVVDNFSTCIPNAITMAPNPKIFVIPNDRDFQRTLADPLTFHARYILDVDPSGAGVLTAPNISYPNLWTTGGGFATDAHTFPAAGQCEAFKLFKVTGHPNLAG